MKLYSLLDRKMKEFGPIVIANNDETVQRALVEGVPGSGNSIDKYRADYDLYCIGSFDVESGVIDPEGPRLVAGVVDILAPTTEAQNG